MEQMNGVPTPEEFELFAGAIRLLTGRDYGIGRADQDGRSITPKAVDERLLPGGKMAIGADVHSIISFSIRSLYLGLPSDSNYRAKITLQSYDQHATTTTYQGQAYSTSAHLALACNYLVEATGHKEPLYEGLSAPTYPLSKDVTLQALNELGFRTLVTWE